MAVAPGHAHLPAIKILHLDKFLAPRQLLPRHCASAHLSNFCNRDNFLSTYQLCTTTLVMLNQFCARTAKSAPYSPCAVTIFWLKYQDSARCLCRVTQPPFIAGPLAVRTRVQHRDCQHTSKSFAAHPCNRPVAAKHMLFCQNISHLSTFKIKYQFLHVRQY
jgi:hypothetical protein